MADNEKASKNRSPEHPVIGLEEAIGRAGEFYEAEHFNFASVASALAHWNYSPKSGPGFRVLGALKHFGLLEERGKGDSREVRLSERGKVLVIKGADDAEWREARREAALTPTIYRKLWDKWGADGRLPSDATMRWELETKQGFNPNAIDSFISAFEATLAFANLTEDDTLSEDADDDSPPPDDTGGGDRADRDRPSARPPMDVTSKDKTDAQTVRVEDYTIPLLGAATAVLSVPVPLTSQNYKKLVGWLEWAKDSLTGEVADDGTDGGA